MNARPNLGWIGLGKMGNPMSTHLLKVGYPLAVYDIAPSAMGALTEQGATAVNSAADVADNADIVISMIPDDAALKTVAAGPQGIFQSAKRGLIYIDMSTVSPAASAHIGKIAEEKGVQYLRAPVSGSTESAVSATLTILVSGSEDAFVQCRPVFEKLGKKVFYVGLDDQARYLKLLINMMVGITSAMTAEALIFGKRGGLNWHQMIDIINSSVIASPLIGFKTRLLKERDFSPAFTAAQMAKDFDIALDAGREMDIPLPLTALVRQLYGAMKATGKAELDYFGLLAQMEDMAGVGR
jgi:3-hydroxyisobutyrate dehydrogenase-like beta-hydroxyacid dehydrogenase